MFQCFSLRGDGKTNVLPGSAVSLTDYSERAGRTDDKSRDRTEPFSFCIGKVDFSDAAFFI